MFSLPAREGMRLNVQDRRTAALALFLRLAENVASIRILPSRVKQDASRSSAVLKPGKALPRLAMKTPACVRTHGCFHGLKPYVSVTLLTSTASLTCGALQRLSGHIPALTRQAGQDIAA